LNWRGLTPVYDPNLSGNHFLARGNLFQIGDAHLYKNGVIAPHWHEAYEMGLVTAGQGVIAMGQHEHAFQKNQIYVINDLEPHMGYATDSQAQLFVVHFHPSILDEGWMRWIGTEAHVPFSPGFEFATPLIPLNDPVTQPVRDILLLIREQAQTKDTAWQVIVGGLLLQAVGLLTRRLLAHEGLTMQHQSRRHALKRISPVLRLIEEHYAEPLSLSEMASAAHLSRSHCCALFRTALDTTPTAYRNARRLSEARRLLQYTDLTIAEIAYNIGFNSVQELNRLFRRANNLTPTQHRQNIRSS
jgi:AraC-like DNA-binding protein